MHPFRTLEKAMNTKGLGFFGNLTISDSLDAYTVNSSSFIETVYPAEGVITLYRNETREVETESIRVAWVTVVSILGLVFTVATIFFVLKCC